MQNAHTLMTRWPPDHAKVTNDIKSWVPASTYCTPDQINKSSKLTKMSRDTATTLTRAQSECDSCLVVPYTMRYILIRPARGHGPTCYPGELKSYANAKDMHLHVYSAFIPNHQIPTATETSFNRRMNKHSL